MPHPALTPALATKLANTALAGITREYPNQIAHAMDSDADAGTPRRLHPAFYGCYDWHSAVHAHWCLARLLRVTDPDPETQWATDARRALDANLTTDNLATETAYLAARPHYERPYGLAWLLQLDTDLAGWPTDDTRRWRAALQPLAALCAKHLTTWADNLTHPVRTGIHSQSAFAMGLAIDRARATGDAHSEQILMRRALVFHEHDAAWSFAFEPSGEDFLSPGLAAADLMRRVMSPDRFSAWLEQCLPELTADAHAPLAPVQAKDPTDGRLAHLDGLSLSRAWMLADIADALDATTGRRPVCHGSVSRVSSFRSLADAHLAAGLAALESDDYNRTHWLASFATYALTRSPARAAP